MKDFNGTELCIGDTVATTLRGYADITKLTVVGFTPQKIKLSSDVLKFPSQVSYVLDTKDNPTTLWARIHQLEYELKGPPGYDTWRDAAVAERLRRIDLENILRRLDKQ